MIWSIIEPLLLAVVSRRCEITAVSPCGLAKLSRNGETIVFNDDMYRKLLLGRMIKLNSNGSTKSINDYLQFVFNGKLVFAVDNYNMSMKVLLYYAASDEDLAVINSDGFLPLPVGVKVTYSVVPPEHTFGFYGSGLTGFDTGTFFDLY
jgi:hypothetical protein